MKTKLNLMPQELVALADTMEYFDIESIDVEINDEVGVKLENFTH